MYREIVKDLMKWRNSDKRKPLVITGMRQCGKTYVISIVGEDTDTLKGKFEGSAFNIDASRHLMPNRKYAGKTCIIRYVHNGHMLAQKSIKIKKD